MTEWLKDCEICNAGLCNRVDNLKEKYGGAKPACKEMEDEAAKKLGRVVWTQNQIYDRYRYYKGLKKQQKMVGNSHQDFETCALSDLQALIDADKKFGTIYADPPWKYSNQSTRASTDNHYETMTPAEIAEMPITQLTTEKAHLHLWTTNAFLFDCPAILEAWGFEYKGVFVWTKNQMGIGNYWRVSHEFMVLGVKGGLTFLDRGQMSWLQADRTKHSVKPEGVAEIIEKVSPGPYLELFGRRSRENWTVWGNEIERTLFNENAF